MESERSIREIIKARYSCRAYREEPIEPDTQRQLGDFISSHQSGPFDSPTRFELIAADDASREALRNLGTYGFIRDPAGFIVGAMGEGRKNLEDFGYAMEHIILYATDLGLGTCWLGGSFTKSRFAETLAADDEEEVPAVVSVGYIAAEQKGLVSRIRKRIGRANRQRKPWEEVFFQGDFQRPLPEPQAGPYAMCLEMVRLGPSASNKQPWRVVKRDKSWHLYIQRTPNYPGWIGKELLGVADMQRIDAGIAMCHFQLTADEVGLEGKWIVSEPSIQPPDGQTEYIASWRENHG